MHLFEIDVINLFADDFNQFGLALETDIGHAHLVHLVDDTLVVGREHLCAVVPIGLVTVVFLRVVAGCEDNAALAAEVADGKRHFRRGAHVVEEIHLDTVGRENVSGGFGEEAAVVAAVVPNDHLDFIEVLEVLVQIVGEALRGRAHRIDVHAVRARSHNAAQSARAEFEAAIEGVDERRLVLVFKHGFHAGFRFCIVERRVEPRLRHLFTLFERLVFHRCLSR